MNYTHSVTSKGQITIPKEFRDRLGLELKRKATLSLNEKNQIVITSPKTLGQVRSLLNQPSHTDELSEKEKLIGKELAKKYGVR